MRPAGRREELPRSRFQSGRARRQGRRLPCAPHVHGAARARRPQRRSARQGFEAFTRQAPAAPPGHWGMPCTGPGAATDMPRQRCPPPVPPPSAAIPRLPDALALLDAVAACAAGSRFLPPLPSHGRHRCPPPVPPPACLPALHAPPAALACGARGRRAPAVGPPAAAKMRIFLPPHAGPTPLLSHPAPIPSTARAPAVPYGGQCTRRQQRAAALLSPPPPATAATRNRPARGSNAPPPRRSCRDAKTPFVSATCGNSAAAPPPPPTVPPGPGPAAQPCGGNARLPGALARLSVPPVQEPVAPAIILLYAPPRTGRRRKPRRPPGSFRLAHRPQRGAPAPSRRRAANRGARQRPASPKRVCVT